MRDRRGVATVRRGALVLALLVAWADAARAQVQSEPQLVFTIYGGLSVGSSLWRIPAQGLIAPGIPPLPQDTVSLERVLRPGLIAGLSAALYRSPHFAWTVDVGYFGLGSEQRCIGPATYQPDSEMENQKTCTSANGQNIATSVVGLMGGATYRFAPSHAVQPFVRATAGLGLIGDSYIQTSGFDFLPSVPGCQLGCPVAILDQTRRSEVTWVVNLATGASIGLSPGYRARFEVRDIITSLPVATGPKDPLGTSAEPPTGWKVKHLPTFLFGLDIVLERRHTRRY
jgi:hypothetical protein